MKHDFRADLVRQAKKHLSMHGFRSKGTTFWRTTTALCQSVSLQKSVYGPTVYVHFAFQLENLDRLLPYYQADVQVRLESFEPSLAKDLDQALGAGDSSSALELWENRVAPIVDAVLERTQTREGLAGWLVTLRGAMVTRRGHEILDGFLHWAEFLHDLRQSLDHHGGSCRIDEGTLIVQKGPSVVAVYGDRRGGVEVVGFEHSGQVTDRDVSERVCSGELVSYRALPLRRYQGIHVHDVIEAVRKTREAIDEMFSALD